MLFYNYETLYIETDKRDFDNFNLKNITFKIQNIT